MHFAIEFPSKAYSSLDESLRECYIFLTICISWTYKNPKEPRFIGMNVKFDTFLQKAKQK